MAYHLHKIGWTVYVVLPNKARKFCEAEGIKTKTDAMDARCLELMGYVSCKLKPSQGAHKESPNRAILPSIRAIPSGS